MPTPSQQASGLLVLPALFVAALVSLPIVVTLLSLAQPAGPIWEHLRETVLNEYLLNTLTLMMLTGGLSLLLGVSTGWLIGAWLLYTYPSPRDLSTSRMPSSA